MPKRVLVDRTAAHCGTYWPAKQRWPPDLAQAADPTLTKRSPFLYGTLLSGETSNHPITLEGGAALFAAQWKTGTLLMTLMSPSGQVIDPAYAAAHPETVTYQESEGYAAYSFPDATAGAWQVRLEATNAPAAGVPYTAFAAFEGDLTLSGGTDHPGTRQGQRQ